MAKTKVKGAPTKSRPAITPEAKENQMISLAMDAAEQQLRDGTASSQVITHFLKLGSEKAKLENEKIRRENILLQAKTDSLKAQEDVKELYSEAINAMKRYSGAGDMDD